MTVNVVGAVLLGLGALALLWEFVRPATPRTATLRPTPPLRVLQDALLDVQNAAGAAGLYPVKHLARDAGASLTFTLRAPDGAARVHELAAEFVPRHRPRHRTVRAGQMIGRVGSTDNSSGPHLHFFGRNWSARHGA